MSSHADDPLFYNNLWVWDKNNALNFLDVKENEFFLTILNKTVKIDELKFWKNLARLTDTSISYEKINKNEPSAIKNLTISDSETTETLFSTTYNNEIGYNDLLKKGRIENRSLENKFYYLFKLCSDAEIKKNASKIHKEMIKTIKELTDKKIEEIYDNLLKDKDVLAFMAERKLTKYNLLTQNYGYKKEIYKNRDLTSSLYYANLSYQENIKRNEKSYYDKPFNLLFENLKAEESFYKTIDDLNKEITDLNTTKPFNLLMFKEIFFYFNNICANLNTFKVHSNAYSAKIEEITKDLYMQTGNTETEISPLKIKEIQQAYKKFSSNTCETWEILNNLINNTRLKILNTKRKDNISEELSTQLETFENILNKLETNITLEQVQKFQKNIRHHYLIGNIIEKHYKTRNQQIKTNVENLKTEQNNLEYTWYHQADAIDRIIKTKESIEEVKTKSKCLINDLEVRYNYNKSKEATLK